VLNAGRNWARSGSQKVLELGTVLLSLAVFTPAAHWKWTVTAVRLAVDAGLLAIVLASLAAGRPFTRDVETAAVGYAGWDSAPCAASSGFLPIGNLQPLADRYGHGNKTRKLFNLREVSLQSPAGGTKHCQPAAERPGLISVTNIAYADLSFIVRVIQGI